MSNYFSSVNESEFSDGDVEESESELISRKRSRSDLSEASSKTSSSGGIFNSFVNKISSGFNHMMNGSYRIFVNKNRSAKNPNERNPSSDSSVSFFDPNPNVLSPTKRGMNVMNTSSNASFNTSLNTSNTSFNTSFNEHSANNQSSNTFAQPLIRVQPTLNSNSMNTGIFLIANNNNRININNNEPTIISVMPQQQNDDVSSSSQMPIVFSSSTSKDQNCKRCGELMSPHALHCNNCMTLWPSKYARTRLTLPASTFYNRTSNPNKRIITQSIGRGHTSGHQTSSGHPILHQIPPIKKTPQCITLTNDEEHCSSLESKDFAIPSGDKNMYDNDNDNDNEAFVDTGIQCDSNDIENKVEQKDINPEIIEDPMPTKQAVSKCLNHQIESYMNKTPTKNISYHEFPDYVMFGTYKCDAKIVIIEEDCVKIQNVPPNSPTTRYKYHISIPFNEMQEYLMCSEMPSLFIKPDAQSNAKIQKFMNLDEKSYDGKKLNINSEDVREHYIIMVFKGKFKNGFVEKTENCARSLNPKIKASKISLEKAKHLIQLAQSKSVDKRIETIIITSGEHKNIFAVSSIPKSRILSSPSSQIRPKAILRTRPNRFASKPCFQVTSTTVTSVIEIDDDDDDNDNDGTKKQSDTDDLNKLILTYPPNEENAIHLSGNDIQCLNGGEYINDNIVNFYLRYIYAKPDSLLDGILSRTHIFDTLFYVQLTEKRSTKRKTFPPLRNEYSFEQRYNEKLKIWTKNVDIFSKDFLILPIIKESHWFLAIICYPGLVINYQNAVKPDDDKNEKKPCIIFMDSLGSAIYKRQNSVSIRNFLSAEWLHKKGTEISFKTKVNMREFYPRVPTQTNSSDCGLFVLEYVEQFLKDPHHIIDKLFEKANTDFEGWFPPSEAKAKRKTIRDLLLKMIPKEMAEKLVKLVKDDVKDESEDEESAKDDLRDSAPDASDSQMDVDYVPDKSIVFEKETISQNPISQNAADDISVKERIVPVVVEIDEVKGSDDEEVPQTQFSQ